MKTSFQLKNDANHASALATALTAASVKADEATKLAAEAANLEAAAVEAESRAATSKAKAKASGAPDSNVTPADAAKDASDAMAAAAAAEKAASDAAAKRAEATAAQEDVEWLEQRAAPAKRDLRGQLIESLNNRITWLMVFSFVLIMYLLHEVCSKDSAILDAVRHTEAARGLITFLFTAVTIAISLMLVYQAFNQGTTPSTFRMAREVFSALVGVLGTIVGFYFGVAKDEPREPSPFGASPITHEGSTWRMHVSGGKPPYKWTLSGDEKAGILEQKGKIATDGTVAVNVPDAKDDGKVTLTAEDSTGARVSRSEAVKKPVPPATPTPPPVKPDAPKDEKKP